MFKVSKRDIRQGYKGIKHLAKKAFKRGDVEKSLEYIDQCATVAQQFNFIYADYELEDLLRKIGEKVLPETPTNYQPVKNRVVFYDDFCVSFILALQYIEALVAANKEILYVSLDGKGGRFDAILETIKGYKKVKIKIIENKNRCQSTRDIYSSIIEFRPEKIFLHIFAKSRIVPALYHLPPKTEKYIINLADQTFWLGVGAVDYVLEFRQFGVSVSQQRRGVKPQQQLLIPFYPIVDGNPFHGFPEGCNTEGKVVIFSGSDLYKVQDKRRMFWHLVKKVMDTFPEVVFWFATKIQGNNINIINEFVRENHYEGRFFYTPFRRDINEVLAHVDIFMGTCPVCGSLMSQLAARNATPILQYYYPGTPDDETEQAICVNEDFQISYQNEELFMAEADKLINDTEYRKRQGERLQKAMVSPEQFNNMVKIAIDTNKTPMPLKPFEMDYEILDNRWFELEELGHVNITPYICGILGKGNTMRFIPRVFFTKMFSKIYKFF